MANKKLSLGFKITLSFFILILISALALAGIGGLLQITSTWVWILAALAVAYLSRPLTFAISTIGRIGYCGYLFGKR